MREIRERGNELIPAKRARARGACLLEKRFPLPSASPSPLYINSLSFQHSSISREIRRNGKPLSRGAGQTLPFRQRDGESDRGMSNGRCRARRRGWEWHRSSAPAIYRHLCPDKATEFVTPRNFIPRGNKFRPFVGGRSYRFCQPACR